MKVIPPKSSKFKKEEKFLELQSTDKTKRIVRVARLYKHISTTCEIRAGEIVWKHRTWELVSHSQTTVVLKTVDVSKKKS